MKKFISYPKIGDFKSAIHEITHSARFTGLDEDGQVIYNHDPLPTLTFTGTVKLHGTNSGVCYNNESGFWTQSRKRIITPKNDNAGFAFFAETHQDAYIEIINQIAADNDISLDEYTVSVFGEWAGCFTYSTPILLADGTKMPIGKIVNNKMNVDVMSYNMITGNLEPKSVINWHKNGQTDQWLKINVKRRKRGGRSTSIICTPNHSIFINTNGVISEVPASKLNIGDKVLVNCNTLHYTLKEFLKGTILGDGSFSSKREIVVSHSDDNQKFYNDFIEKIFNGISSTRSGVSGYGSNMKTHNIHAFPEIEDIYNELYSTDNTRKLPTFEYLNTLSPIALATWYMDDGSLAVHNKENRQVKACLHVEGFGSDTVELISSWFNSRGFECNTIVNKRGNKELRLSPKGTNSFLYHIAPYVLKEFNYKLPSYLHNIGKINWWTHIVGEYDNSILSTEIKSIESYTPDTAHKKERYDITVNDNSNYFANGILVHNSGIQKNVAISELDKAFYLFGVKISKSEDPEFNNYWVDSTKYVNEDQSIFNVDMFKKYTITVDLNNPGIVVNDMIDLVQDVEGECPISKARGVSGVGEGIVWRTKYKNNIFRYKTKGAKHSVTKVKKLVQIDSEKLKSVADFVNFSVTQNRVDQGIQLICGDDQPTKAKTGPFLKWLVNDIIDEELTTLVDNGLEPKDVTSALSTAARNMFFKACDEW
jgi:hypothetical protein